MVVFLYLTAKIIPPNWGYRLCEYLGVITYSVLPKYRRIAMDNLEVAFGQQMPLSNRKNICRDMFINMVKSLYEFLLFSRFSRQQILSMVNLDVNKIREHVSSGNGVIILTAHIGNWELLAAGLVSEGFRLTVIGKDMRDKWISRLMIRMRESTGVKNVPKGKGVFKPITEALNRNELVGLLADQNAGASGRFVDFFGTPASTFTGPAVFAAKTGAVILPAFCIRRRDNSHKVIFYDPIFPSDPADEESVYKCTEQYTKCIEKVVREYPEQWLWLHKRWKTKPESVVSGG